MWLGLILAFIASTLLNGQIPQDEIRRDIAHAFEQQKIPVRVSARDGRIVLEGRVRNVFVKTKALQVALSQRGVDEVESEIEIVTPESAKELNTCVARGMRGYGQFTVFDDVSAGVDDGNVVLMGWVTDGFKKTDLEERMHPCLGIQVFENRIEALPASEPDQRLRRRLARRLYRDPLFLELATMVVPPIHIVVKNGHVLLTGVVSSNVSLRRAESLLRNVPGVLSLQNQLRTER